MSGMNRRSLGPGKDSPPSSRLRWPLQRSSCGSSVGILQSARKRAASATWSSRRSRRLGSGASNWILRRARPTPAWCNTSTQLIGRWWLGFRMLTLHTGRTWGTRGAWKATPTSARSVMSPSVFTMRDTRSIAEQRSTWFSDATAISTRPMWAGRKSRIPKRRRTCRVSAILKKARATDSNLQARGDCPRSAAGEC